MYFSKLALLSLSLGFIGVTQANHDEPEVVERVTFCVRDGGNENEGYGPFSKKKNKETRMKDLTKEWDDAGKQVLAPGKKAHVHGVDGWLDTNCKLTHMDGDRKKLTLCYRDEGHTDHEFKKVTKPVEKFNDSFMHTYDSYETVWPGKQATIKGKTQYLDEKCDGSDKPVMPSVYGDPHFTTWHGVNFDFHGACDMVMLENSRFANGLGLKIHIRTTIDASNTWSFISAAAIQLGDNTLEVMGAASSGSGTYWINGQQGQEVQEGQSSLGDFHVNINRINDHQGRVRLDLGGGNAIAIEIFKRFVRVNLGARLQPESFSGSVGVLGTYDEDGDMLARDGKTIMQDPTEFGQEWQVLSSEPMLFHKAGPIQHPAKCAMPNNKDMEFHTSRRLGEGSAITQEDAALACARVSPQDRDACIFDVMATNDKDLAGSY